MSLPEIVTMGRIGVDLYPEQSGVGLEDVTSFRKLLGGSPTNVAVAAARLGRSAAVVTRVGDDAFGRFCVRALRDFGVDPGWVGVHPALRTPLAFCALHPPDDFPLLFYREPRAPDLELEAAALDRDLLAGCALLWTTGTGLTVEPSRAATLAALELRPPGAHAVHDLDFRPMFWPAPADATRWGREAVARASVVVGNTAEAAVVVGEAEPLEQARRLLALGPGLAIVKRGPDGVVAASAAGEWSQAPIRLPVRNGLGAGDAFGGVLAHGLLAGWDVPRILRYANAAGALVASRLGCADAMPGLAELEALLDGAPVAA